MQGDVVEGRGTGGKTEAVEGVSKDPSVAGHAVGSSETYRGGIALDITWDRSGGFHLLKGRADFFRSRERL